MNRYSTWDKRVQTSSMSTICRDDGCIHTWQTNFTTRELVWTSWWWRFHMREFLPEFGLSFLLQVGFSGHLSQMLLNAQPARQNEHGLLESTAAGNHSSATAPVCVVSPDVWLHKAGCVEFLSLVPRVHVPGNGVLFEAIPWREKWKAKTGVMYGFYGIRSQKGVCVSEQRVLVTHQYV